MKRFIIRCVLLVLFPVIPLIWTYTLVAHGWARRPDFREIVGGWWNPFRKGRF